jgi:hypothetical protein
MSEPVVVFKKKRRRDESSIKPKSTLNVDEQTEIAEKEAPKQKEQESSTILPEQSLEEKEKQIASDIGPVKSSSSVKMSIMFDYKPDICKDYKQTGYCGYGDSCIFLHDRGDYKSGWELEKEWEEQQRKKRTGLMNSKTPKESESSTTEDAKFICSICKKRFVDPVKTKCGHVFCEECALQHHKTDKKCAICKEPTMGIFNTAREMIESMKKEQTS